MSGKTTSFSCTCYTYKLNNTLYPAGDCVHCQFALSICPFFLSVPSPVTQFDQMLHNALQSKDSNIIELSSSAHVRKFVVKGVDEENSAMFVHLQTKYAYVKCMSGVCNIQMGCRRSLKSLLKSTCLCPHLQVFRDNSEMWSQLLGIQVPDPLPAEEVMFPESLIEPTNVQVCFFLTNLRGSVLP